MAVNLELELKQARENTYMWSEIAHKLAGEVVNLSHGRNIHWSKYDDPYNLVTQVLLDWKHDNKNKT